MWCGRNAWLLAKVRHLRVIIWLLLGGLVIYTIKYLLVLNRKINQHLSFCANPKFFFLHSQNVQHWQYFLPSQTLKTVENNITETSQWLALYCRPAARKRKKRDGDSKVGIMFHNHDHEHKAWWRPERMKTDTDHHSPVSERVQLCEDGIEHPLRLR